MRTTFRRIADDLDKVEGAYCRGVRSENRVKLQIKSVKLWPKMPYMTGEEAVNLGFADALDESKKIKASIDGDNVIVNGQTFNLKKL